VEILEVLDGPLLHRFQERNVVRVRGTFAELVPSVSDAAFEVRNHAAHVMGDDLQSRKLVEVSGEYEPRHCDARLVWPAERPPNFVQRFGFALIIREVRSPRWMDPDRNIPPDGLLKDWQEFRSIERLARGVRVDLNAERAKLIDRAFHFPQRRVGVV